LALGARTAGSRSFSTIILTLAQPDCLAVSRWLESQQSRTTQDSRRTSKKHQNSIKLSASLRGMVVTSGGAPFSPITTATRHDSMEFVSLIWS
jgi:hypothetical protein